MWWMERRLYSQELIGDCEAFLSGRYAERLRRRAVPVPTWAWTNLLAHGTEADLRSELASSQRALRRGWPAARAYLTTEVLTAVDRGTRLADLQREVLRPLELELAADGSDDPRRWVVGVAAALARYENSHRRRPPAPAQHGPMSSASTARQGGGQ